MRMRPHVDALAGAENRRAEMVEKDKRTDHARPRRRQRAANLQSPEINRARHNNLRDCIGRRRIAESRVLGWKKAHRFTTGE
jgi:hypothetical protein